MVKILSLDASTEACSVALLSDNNIDAIKEVTPQGHTKVMLSLVDQLLNRNNITLNDLDAVACGVGPGSFTGVRIGVSMAQGLAFGADKKLIGIGDLKAMAWNAIKDTKVDLAVSAIDARMSEVYLGIYKRDEQGNVQQLIENKVLSPENARKEIESIVKNLKFCYCGTGFNTYPQIIEGLNAVKANEDLPWADAVAELASVDFADNKAEDPENVQPLYVRDTVTWKKVNEQ